MFTWKSGRKNRERERERERERVVIVAMVAVDGGSCNSYMEYICV